MAKTFDCVVCGASVVDILVRPLPLAHGLRSGEFLHVEPLEMVTGGGVPNCGIAMTRLGLEVAAFSCVGDDGWGDFLRQRCRDAGLDVSHMLTHETTATSATAVLIDRGGEHTFAHYPGAWTLLDKDLFLSHLELFARSRMALIGYYSLLPHLEPDLAEVLERIRETGCQTALDTAAQGGGLEPLDRALPHLDVYVPSLGEARAQTGEDDPEKILATYRACGAPGVLGVKLGEEGALLSAKDGEYLQIPPVPPPGPVVDTTGAGDSFYSGLLCGLLRGLPLDQAGRLAAAAGACCVTGLGASAGVRSFEETKRLAGLS